jgi:uncharacterized protein (DUF2252 family)
MNDFDESILAPCTWELTRFLTSVILGTSSLGVNESEAMALCDMFLRTYTTILEQGHTRVVETDTSSGMIKELLVGLEKRQRSAFLDDHTTLVKGERKLKLDGKKQLPVSAADRKKITALLEGWSSKQTNPDFYKLLDVAHRVAGTGSLGVERYILLVEGKGSPDRNYLLDLKAEDTSSLQPYVRLEQPAWASPAARVVAIQRRMQGTPPALLAALDDAELAPDNSFLLKELQPFQDKLDLINWNGKLRRLEKLMSTMGEIIGWNQLRSGGRQGSAIADDLVAFAESPTWHSPMLDYARAYSQKVNADYQEFCAAYDNKQMQEDS